MNRFFVVVVLFAAATSSTGAADWSETAFPVKSHDFGTVAVAAKTEFRFPIHNPFSGPMHIQSVRASCGCTTPILESHTIAPNERGALLARFNTDTFRGKRGATLTVVIDQPFYSEVRLRVDGYIRSDMVFHPGAIEFGRVDQGSSMAKSTKVYYAGRDDWQILNVRSNKAWLVPTLSEVSRGGGRVNYEIAVALREDAPQGFFQDELVVRTNDRGRPRVPLKVSGQVDSALSVSPKAIALREIKPGQPVTQKLILLGRKPFLVQSIQADGWDIEFTPTDEMKTTHIVYPKLTFVGNQSGQQKSSIEITTSGEQSVTATALLTAEIRDR